MNIQILLILNFQVLGFPQIIWIACLFFLFFFFFFFECVIQVFLLIYQFYDLLKYWLLCNFADDMV